MGIETYAFRRARPDVIAVGSSRKLICKQNIDRRCTFALVEPHQRRPRPAHARKKLEHATCSSVIERGAQSPGDWTIRVRALEDHLQHVKYFAPQKIRKPRLVVNLEQLKSHLPSRTPLPQPENSRRASPRNLRSRYAPATMACVAPCGLSSGFMNAWLASSTTCFRCHHSRAFIGLPS